MNNKQNMITIVSRFDVYIRVQYIYIYLSIRVLLERPIPSPPCYKIYTTDLQNDDESIVLQTTLSVFTCQQVLYIINSSDITSLQLNISCLIERIPHIKLSIKYSIILYTYLYIKYVYDTTDIVVKHAIRVRLHAAVTH